MTSIRVALVLMLSLVLFKLAICHGKFESADEIAFREAHIIQSKRSIDACAAKRHTPEALRIRKSMRHQFIDSHLKSRGFAADLFARDDIVSGSNSSCILTPEAEEGPYWVNGSLVRKDVREDQAGIDLLLDIQVFDVRTCEPIKGVILDFWNANATGVYSNEDSEGTLGLTYLRGLRKTDGNGLAQLITTFPGWYAGRAQHVHVKAHVNYTMLSNGSIGGGEVVHTGQMFFEQSTLSTINSFYPYTLDPNTLTPNTEDRVIQDQQNTTYYDAFLDIRSLGYNLTAGVIGFIDIAINPTVVPAAVGGNANTGSGAAPAGSKPTGAVPTGTMASSSLKSSGSSKIGTAASAKTSSSRKTTASTAKSVSKS